MPLKHYVVGDDKTFEEAYTSDEIDALLAQILSINAIVALSVSGTTITYTRSDGSRGTINTEDTTYSNATTTRAGLMSAADKSKLDGIQAQAQVNTLTGVKGSAESSYRTGNVNITKDNIGLGNVENKSSATIRGELTAANVTNALGYTPSAGIANVYQAGGEGNDFSPADGVIDHVPLTASGAKISGSGMSVSTYGIKVASAGLYRITAGVYMQVPAAANSYGVYLKKSANGAAFANSSEMAGVLYPKPTSAGVSTTAEISSIVIFAFLKQSSITIVIHSA